MGLQKCSIVTPGWLHDEELKAMRDEEKRISSTELAKVPRHYIEIAHALLVQSKTYANRAREKERMMTLLRELFEVSNSFFEVSEMSAVEVGCFRTRSLQALDV